MATTKRSILNAVRGLILARMPGLTGEVVDYGGGELDLTMYDPGDEPAYAPSIHVGWDGDGYTVRVGRRSGVSTTLRGGATAAAIFADVDRLAREFGFPGWPGSGRRVDRHTATAGLSGLGSTPGLGVLGAHPNREQWLAIKKRSYMVEPQRGETRTLLRDQYSDGPLLAGSKIKIDSVSNAGDRGIEVWGRVVGGPRDGARVSVSAGLLSDPRVPVAVSLPGYRELVAIAGLGLIFGGR